MHRLFLTLLAVVAIAPTVQAQGNVVAAQAIAVPTSGVDATFATWVPRQLDNYPVPPTTPPIGSPEWNAADEFIPMDESPVPWLTGISVSARLWQSVGRSDRNFRVGDVNVASDLRWTNLVSEVLETSVSVLAFGQLTLNVELGTGGVDNGQFRDYDYGLPDRNDLYSDTLSPVKNGNLHYYNFNAGWRVFENDDVIIDGLVSYQYWRERYTAEGGTVIVPNMGPVVLPAGPVDTEKFTWQGFRIGAQVVLPYTERVNLRSRVLMMPVTHYKMEDIHHLRVDLMQDPSIIDRATGGFGVMGDVSISYWVGGGLYLDLGYRVWDVQSGSGEKLNRFADGTTAQVPLNNAHTMRQGFVLNAILQF